MILHELVVVMPFGNYQRGHVISDPDVVKKILDIEGEWHSNISNVRKTSNIIAENIQSVDVAPQQADKPQDVIEEKLPEPSISLSSSKLKEKKQ